ncbi:uncharacterized protein LOC106646177, partial [Copidosoma floridanum]|uniref:uncharacterized protein LOC106646177 n=1 Tax=Copidosoma floridanum TaxID=29053 RepID=UPI000C6FACFE
MKFWRCGLALAPMLLVCGASTAVDDLRNGTTSDFPPINYTHVGENANSVEYKVQTEANHASSMKALYALTNGFIDLIQGKEALPEGFIDINENNIIEVKWNTGKLLKHYGFLTALSIVLL